MRQSLRTLTATVLVGFLLTVPGLAAAAFEDWSGLKPSAGTVGYNLGGASDPAVVIGRLIQYVFSLLGIIFLSIILIGYMKIGGAGGNDEDVAKGKKWIKNGILGILILMSAYILTELIFFAVKGNIFKT